MNRSRLSRPWPALARLMLVALTLAVTLAACSLGSSPTATPAATATPPPPTGPEAKLDSVLLDIYRVYQRSGRPAAEQHAREVRLLTENNEIAITLVLSDTNTKPVEDKVTSLGGKVVNTAPSQIDILVPLDVIFGAATKSNILTELAGFSTVQDVRVTRYYKEDNFGLPTAATREELRAALAVVVSEGVASSGADKWHAAGITGKGVKVGVLDLGFFGYEDLKGQELPTNITFKAFNRGRNVGGASGKVDHGTAVTEIIHGMAPDAELYLGTIDSDTSVENAMRWLTDEAKVQVINMSFGSTGYERMDGTGRSAQIVDAARKKGVLCVVSAGNSGDEHYAATFTDSNGNGYHEFAPGKESLKVQAGTPAFEAVLSWEAWTGPAVNYDLELYDAGGKPVVSASGQPIQSTIVQGPGKGPVEAVEYDTKAGTIFNLKIKKVGTQPNVPLQIFVHNSTPEIQTPQSSLGTPGDAKLAFTVAATRASDDGLENYSSQGPTLDGRLKPEIAGQTVVSTASYNKKGKKFNGTSAAAPHVTGGSALVFSAQPGATADQVQQFIQARAKDLLDPGPDNKTGYGRLTLGDPATARQGGNPAGPTPPAAGPAGPAFTDTFATPGALPASGQLAYANGRYVITSRGSDALWATYNAPYANATLAADVEISGVAAAGLVFWQVSDQDYHAALITPDGYYQVAHFAGGRWTSLTPWTKTPAIKPTGPNTLQVQTSGPAITVTINGASLGPVQAPAPGRGKVGMIAAPFGQATTATFATFKITPAP